jgi:hypothetical protein
MTEECARKYHDVCSENLVTSVKLTKLHLEKKICNCKTACLGRKDCYRKLKKPSKL